jgi:integrase
MNQETPQDIEARFVYLGPAAQNETPSSGHHQFGFEMFAQDACNLVYVMWRLLADVGESIKTAQSLLGHSDLGTTLNTYAHVIPGSQRRAVERVAGVLFSDVLKLDDGAKDGRVN